MMMVRKSKGLGERHHRILAFLQQYQRTLEAVAAWSFTRTMSKRSSIGTRT